MKALTLHQPWATLIALGVKTIETRSWPAPKALIGQRFAIHAGARWPGHFNIPKLWSVGTTHVEQDEANKRTWLVCPVITDPAFHGPQPCNPVTGRQRHIPRRAKTPMLWFPHSGPHGRGSWDSTLGTSSIEQGKTMYLPLGCIVATARLVDCLPIVDPATCEWHSEHPRGVAACGHAAVDGQVIVHTPDRPMHTTVTCDLPFGDYTPGRWAWLLDDVNACDPVPVSGHRRVWEWTP